MGGCEGGGGDGGGEGGGGEGASKTRVVTGRVPTTGAASTVTGSRSLAAEAETNALASREAVSSFAVGSRVSITA